METVEALVLIGVVFSVLYVFWVILEDVFGLIDQWHAASRERREDMETNLERER